MSASTTLEVSETIATITMARAPVNALDRKMREELIHMLDALSVREDVRAIILRSGLKVFTAGVDLRESVETEGPSSRRNMQRLNRELFAALRDATVPVIAVVDGPAIGAGVALMAACDLVLCSPKAEIRLPEIDHGRIADVSMLRRLLPRTVAASLAFLGRNVTAQQLMDFGLCSAICDSSEIDQRAREWAAEIASKEPGAVRATKFALSTSESLPWREGARFVQRLSDGLV